MKATGDWFPDTMPTMAYKWCSTCKDYHLVAGHRKNCGKCRKKFTQEKEDFAVCGDCFKPIAYGVQCEGCAAATFSTTPTPPYERMVS